MSRTYLARTTRGDPLVGSDAGFVPLSAANPGATSMTAGLRAAAAGTLAGPADAPAQPISPEVIDFGPPVPRPGTILGIGLNYAAHAADLSETRPDEPASFLKPSNTVVGPGGPIRLPRHSDRVTAEAELGVVFGRTCNDVDADSVEPVVAGFLPIIDVTAEDILERNPRFLTRAKSFDTFLVEGPVITVPERPWSIAECTVETRINDTVVARDEVERMHFSPSELIAFQSSVRSFHPGDLLTTGTPGAGVIDHGDRVTASIDEVGEAYASVC